MITIYEIECKENGRKYVGSTKGTIQKRMREHRCLLNQGSHSCGDMQADWVRFGPDAFWVYPAGNCDDDLTVRRQRELERMTFWESRGLLYNEHKISMQPTEEARQKGVANAHREPGNRWTPEANERRRLAQLGKPKGHGAKISATKRANKR